MRTTTARIASLAAVAALALAGCGGMVEDEPVAAPTIAAEEAAEAPSPSDDGGEPTEGVAAPEMGDTDDEGDAANEVTGHGVYRGETWHGATVTIAAPGEGPEDLEALREMTGTDPVGYLIAELDNTDGEETAMLYEVRIVDSEGETHVYREPGEATWDWTSDSWDEEVIQASSDIYDDYPFEAVPTAKITVPLIGPEVPEDIVSVVIDDVRAEKVGEV